ncbi:DUF1385 domain-containing protein [Eggerthella sp. YY7918]|uniref:DUF1385 domain-containing protein n=1 Tax=Eggerthella sp. (strain YY7918) TaxID=502558 RepID=UPI0002171347|nr:DUF1385 domain-containing protein [Eggerthella sp. YY7918]BAK44239.1 hypothetical protein EGYY_10610 [Eggerthella sp. YY7918]
MPEQKSDLSRAFSEDGALKTHVGGQALIEGIMMRGKYNWSVAVREPSGGIYVEEHDLSSGRNKNGWMHWPLVRGCRALVESLVLGYKALEIAALHAFSDESGDANGESEGLTTTPRCAARPTAEPSDSCASLLQSEENKNGVQRVAVNPSDSPFAGGQGITKIDGTDSIRSGEAGSSKEESDDLEGTRVQHEGSLAGEEGFDGVQRVATAPSASASAGEVDSSKEEGDNLGGIGVQHGDSLAGEEGFSWKDDFGRPDVVIDALGAQRTLEVVSETSEADASDDSKKSEKKSFLDEEVEFGKGAMAVSMVLGLVLGVVLFIVAPAFLTNLIVGEYDSNTVAWNIVDGLLRVAVFVFYLWLIGRMSDIKRMFGYHGAEHKTIHCYEHGLPLTPENARSFPRLHVRCGTAFLIMVMVIAIFVYTVTPLNALIDAWGVPDGAPKLALVILVRILLMPVIAGISYEITVKWAGSHPDNPLVKIVLWPGMQMQYLTTNEPDDGMIECAIAAMQRVLEREEAEGMQGVPTAEKGEVTASTAA